MPEEKLKISPGLIIVGGLGLGLVAVVGVAAMARAAIEVVTVALQNPPSGATMWSMTLLDWDITTPIYFRGRNGKDRLDLTEVATFEIPSGLTLPLRIMALQITRWNEDETALIVLYEVQSFRPYLWDWEAQEWSDVPDPGYREAFIPGYGSYFYNVYTEGFLRDVTGELFEP